MDLRNTDHLNIDHLRGKTFLDLEKASMNEVQGPNFHV